MKKNIIMKFNFYRIPGIPSFSICFLQLTKMLLKPFKAILDALDTLDTLDTFIFLPCDPPPLTKPDLKFFKVFLVF